MDEGFAIAVPQLNSSIDKSYLTVISFLLVNESVYFVWDPDLPSSDVCPVINISELSDLLFPQSKSNVELNLEPSLFEFEFPSCFEVNSIT